ncbi:CCN family member 2-like isoform X2 [Salarias fasciatus]|uniref:CCN family member 3 n=2 Tax=Salarias fasciatus TaxID=181472 RepID=A0A672GIQ4_SALFA|nr:CCN family member 2-like isoform X2 [Salarias fasciatus]
MSSHVPEALWLLLAVLQSTVSQDCSQTCSCPADPPRCPVGTSLVLDGCGCCKVCARQLREPCSLLEPCDHHKDLYCDYTLLSDTQTGVCMAQDGQPCVLGRRTYGSGESFRPTCKHQCVCMNGEIGCVPTCPTKARPPSPDCPYPRPVHIPGKCCEDWVCHQTPPERHYQAVSAGVSHVRPLVPQSSPPGLPAESPRENCIVQTTAWSECSASCGMGISSRVTNDNRRCQLERQTRICMVRPCSSQQERDIRKGKKCIRTPRAQLWMRFRLSGCSSSRLYRPRFCGVCTDGRCCTPSTSVTASVEFRCPEGDVFTRKMMFIKTCSCHHHCQQDNDIFLASSARRMSGDYDSTL